MIKKEVQDILSAYEGQGWVSEPAAKQLLASAGLPVTRSLWTKTVDDAIGFAGEIGYPVVAKVVSPEIVHKSDQGGVVVGIANAGELAAAFDRFRRFSGFAGVLVEEMLSGLELIVGAIIDFQFGPVILLGIGGTRAEIYRDTVLRMAPLDEAGVGAMVKGLRAHSLLEGYRGGDAINLPELTGLIMGFSRLVMEIEELIASVDLNPVICSSKTCIIADARIMLKSSTSPVTPSPAHQE
jgi:acetate---CoA ligase (ADP-forming) subunit beta